MKKFFLTLLLIATPAFGADRVLVNPDSNADLKLKVTVGTTTTDALTVTGASGAVTVPVSFSTPSLRALSTNATNYVEFTSAASLSSNLTYIWPGTTTNGGLLTSNGTGTLSWLAPGTASTVLHGGTTPAYSAITSGDLPTTLTGKTLDSTSTLASGITASAFTASGNTVTLPASATTLAGLATTQAFSAVNTFNAPASPANSPGILVNGASGWYAADLANTNAAGSSHGLRIRAGGQASDTSLAVNDRSNSTLLYVSGAGLVGVTGSGANAGLQLPNTNSSGGTQATCQDYDKGTFTANFTGARSVSISVAYVRVCNMVTLHFQRSISVNCPTAAPFLASGGIPTRLRSSFGSVGQSNWPMAIMDNGTSSPSLSGDVYITSSGTIGIEKSFTSSNFTAGNLCGWYETAISYPIF